MLAYSNERVRDIILLLAPPGIRVGAVYSIKPKHLKVLAEINGVAKEMLLGHSIGLDDK